MRVAIITLGAIAFLTLPAQAQTQTNPNSMHGLPGMEKPPESDQHPAVKADEKAYRSALDGIQPRKSNDPWATVRSKPSSTSH